MTALGYSNQIESNTQSPTLLKVRNLGKGFPVKMGLFKSGRVSAVEDVSFDVKEGETLGIVGESGCGKSTTARLLLRLIESDTGLIEFGGQNLKTLTSVERKEIRRNMQMVFQDPYSALNPRMTIKDNIAFPMRVHRFPEETIRTSVFELMEQVGLHTNYASYYPSQLSGGQLQRVNIARALALKPRLVICDEAVAALDKSIQAQVLNLLKDLQKEFNLTYIFISHDLNVVEYMSDRVLVMYLGQVVETCDAEELYQNPQHPYTKLLLKAIPDLDFDKAIEAVKAVKGELPSPLFPPPGCRFSTRCPDAMEVCSRIQPAFRQPVPGHSVACHLYE
jgi:oligopeptide/dipeptide ABC transporter ATP-binding protein